MDLISNFITKNIINSLEKEFISHAPDLQQDFLQDVAIFTSVIVKWIEEKINHGEIKDEKK